MARHGNDGGQRSDVIGKIPHGQRVEGTLLGVLEPGEKLFEAGVLIQKNIRVQMADGEKCQVQVLAALVAVEGLAGVFTLGGDLAERVYLFLDADGTASEKFLEKLAVPVLGVLVIFGFSRNAAPDSRGFLVGVLNPLDLHLPFLEGQFLLLPGGRIFFFHFLQQSHKAFLFLLGFIRKLRLIDGFVPGLLPCLPKDATAFLALELLFDIVLAFFLGLLPGAAKKPLETYGENGGEVLAEDGLEVGGEIGRQDKRKGFSLWRLMCSNSDLI